jgi:hypothetical protein
VIPVAGALGGRRRAEPDGRSVDLLLTEGEPIAGGRAEDDLRTQLRAGAGDEYLERLGRVLGLLLRPEPVHETGCTAARVQIVGEQRDQGSDPRAADLLTAERHCDSRISSMVTGSGQRREPVVEAAR